MKKKIYSIILCSLLGIMLITPNIYAASDASVVGNVVRLEKTVGNVSLKTAEGASVQTKKGIRLLNGYTLSTQIESYAFFNIDNEKSVKLDALSECSFQKRENVYELLLKKGNLFFNVARHFEGEEMLEIRTSTMITSIHGTAGYVHIEDSDSSSFTLLTGEVKMHYNNSKNNNDVITLKPGDVAKAYSENNIEKIEVSRLDPTHLPLYVLDELKNNSALLNEFETATGFIISFPLDTTKKYTADQLLNSNGIGSNPQTGSTSSSNQQNSSSENDNDNDNDSDSDDD